MRLVQRGWTRPSRQFLNFDIAVGVDANLTSDLQPRANNFRWFELRVGHKRASRREGVCAAGANRQDVIRGGDHVACTADEQEIVAIQHYEHRLKPPEDAVGAPLLRQFRGGLWYRTLVVAKFLFEAFQQAERIGSRPGKPRKYMTIVQFANLAGVGLHHNVAERDLAVAPKCSARGSPDG